MKNPPDRRTMPALRDAYKAPGFRVRAKIESYEEIKPAAFVVTLDRRSKKRCAGGAESFAAACMTNAGDGRAILGAEAGKFISIFTCAALHAGSAA
jgi:hypothetical protein